MIRMMHIRIILSQSLVKFYNITKNIMIHEAKITFHSFQYFNFHRKQDAQNYKLGTEYSLYIMFDRNNLSFLIDHENPLCKIKTKVIDFNLKDMEENKIPENQLTVLYIPPVKKSGEIFHVKLATIKSSRIAIEGLKEYIDKNRKYKSCLAFVPSRVKHISILSGQSPTQKFRGFINLAGVMFLILNLRNIIDNFIRYGIKFGTTPTEFVPVHFLVATAMFAIFPLSIFFIQKMQFRKVFAPAITKFFCVINFVFILMLNIFYCLAFKPAPFFGITHTALTIIMLLKLISYYQVNHQLYSIIQRMEKKVSKSQKQIEVQMFTHYEISQQNLDHILQFKGQSQKIINLKELIYFLFIPTLCYQLTYPKTSSIRYIWLAKRTTQLILVTGFMAIMWFQYIQVQLNQLLKAVHSPDSTWYEIFNRHLRVSIPNTMLWVAGFYAVFHLWLNITGEILYFGDRNFYRDWWNCRSIQEYWKTWNLPVHFWFIRHLYNPILQMGSSRITANLIVFFVSAVAHQYLVSVPLGFISYWAFLAMLMQAPAIFIQKKLDKILRIQNSELSNVSFWIFFCIVGQPLVVFIYYSMYTDYVNCTGNPKITGFIPLDIPLDINLKDLKLQL